MKRMIFALVLVGALILSGCGEPAQAATDPAEIPVTEAATETFLETEPSETTIPSQTQEEPAETLPEAPEEPLVLYCSEVTLIQEGQSIQLYTGSRDRNQIVWSSSDPQIATVEDGLVTFLSEGDARITATTPWEEVSCLVHCDLSYDRRKPLMLPPQEQYVPDSYFDDAVFVGDSVTYIISVYATDQNALGNAQYLCRSSYGIHNGIINYIKLTYRGEEYRFEDAIAATGCKKVFILLGVNDLGVYGVDQTIQEWSIYLERIRKTCPDVSIYIISLLPMWPGSEHKTLTNSNIDTYNSKLAELARQENCHFIDVAPYMKAADGALAEGYCSDEYVHPSRLGSMVFLQVLKAYTGYQ